MDSPRASDPPSAVAAQDRIEFETLISDASAALMLASPGEVRAAIDAAIGQVRTFFRADRAGLLTVSADQQVVNVLSASYASGVSPVSGDINLVEWFPWSRQVLLVERVPLAVARMAELPPEAAEDRASWASMATRSALTVPILTGSAVTHLIVVHTVAEERDWPPEHAPRLRLLGEMMKAALERARTVELLRAGEAHRREQMALLAAAVDAAEMGFSEQWDGDGPSFYDPYLRDLFGLEPGDEERMPALWLSRVDPRDREWVKEWRRRVQDGEVERATAEYRYEHPRRGHLWLRHAKRRLPGGPAQIGLLRVVSAVQDITDRRSREEALQAAHDDLKRLRDRVARENVYLRKEAAQTEGGDLVAGRSPAIRGALALADQVAATASTVLLVGETGTGKERFATYIHRSSPRREGQMVRVNCSAIPSALIESELFGREKGAYTGALSKQIGRFELAHRSTLFLDEIGDLPLETQTKLLRVLQEHTIERLGSPASIGVDVRIIAATNRDLEAAVRAGTFRSDLYYRLNVFPIVIPPLRDRLEDLPGLVKTLVDELGATMRKRIDAVDRASLDALSRYHWPGNVRELRNVLERAMILASGHTLTVAPPRSSAVAPLAMDARAAGRDLHDVEREHILRVLEETGWRIRGTGAAADVLGLKPTTLEARMAKLAIRRPKAGQGA